jgi:hypothetical protein
MAPLIDRMKAAYASRWDLRELESLDDWVAELRPLQSFDRLDYLRLGLRMVATDISFINMQTRWKPEVVNTEEGEGPSGKGKQRAAEPNQPTRASSPVATSVAVAAADALLHAKGLVRNEPEVCRELFLKLITFD